MAYFYTSFALFSEKSAKDLGRNGITIVTAITHFDYKLIASYSHTYKLLTKNYKFALSAFIAYKALQSR